MDKEKIIKDFFDKIRDKYPGNSIPLSVIGDEQKRLEKKHKGIICFKTFEELTTDEERSDKILYDAITSFMENQLPEVKRFDKQIKFNYKIRYSFVSLFKRIKKNIWFFVGLLLILAILKYLLS